MPLDLCFRHGHMLYIFLVTWRSCPWLWLDACSSNEWQEVHSGDLKKIYIIMCYVIYFDVVSKHLNLVILFNLLCFNISYSRLCSIKAYFFFFFWVERESFNLWCLLLMIALYHQTKTPISFWCKRGLNLKSLIYKSLIQAYIRDFTSWANWNPLIKV